jgi:hypothetical protein
MAELSRQIFQTPVGRTYNPSQSIDRSFDKTAGLIVGAMQRESDRLRREEETFGELYSNIGELEGKLNENYAGIQMDAIKSSRDFVKEHIKKGGRFSDPEFKLKLGEMTGRIKASMSNADRNRELLKQAAETIKADPSITEKGTALNNLWSKMNDPDFLISKNAFDLEEYLDNYVNPLAVFKGVANELPTLGKFENQFYNNQGDLKSREILVNPLINKDNPFNEQGGINVNISDDFVSNVIGGTYGQRPAKLTQKLVETKYSDLPKDEAYRMALAEVMTPVLGATYQERTIKSKADIDKDARVQARADANLDRQNRALDLQNRRFERADKSELAQEELEKRYSYFFDAVEGGSSMDAFLGQYQDPKIREIKVIDKVKSPDYEKIDTKQKWDKLDRDERIKIIEDLGLEDDVPTNLIGRWNDKDQSIYDKVSQKILEKTPAKQLSYVESVKKEIDPSGERTVSIPIENENDIQKAFLQLENSLSKGQRLSKPTPKGTKASDPSKDLRDLF